MSIKVLIVDDSHFFRRCIGDIVKSASDMEVIDFAKNGREGVDKALALKPDVVMMDIEMPVLDGISAVREIMAKCPMPVLMFSSLTHDGAKATLDALDAGAADFLPKKFEEIAGSGKVAAELITNRIRALVRQRRFAPRARVAVAPNRTDTKPVMVNRPSLAAAGSARLKSSPEIVNRHGVRTNELTTFKPSGKRYSLLAIASSTGGPVALQELLIKLPSNFSYPIVLVQHMPAAFTGAFAERLDRLCQINVKEAQDNDIMKPGCAYLAPGGQQMLIEKNHRLKVTPGPDHLNYKPSADMNFASIAKNHDGNVLTVILTGMGADGRDGARLLNSRGSTIWAQDEASCVVYGMPQAVTKAGLTDKIFTIKDIGQAIVKEMQRG
ncbi:MAG: chemotaxis response regulator protein-glutamate methylesterase [Gammaproteobacteria bacterium]|nr:chemotaxis response regulator protein-glutamate methylesterase [Gammaproteobacteria bacterium]